MKKKWKEHSKIIYLIPSSLTHLLSFIFVLTEVHIMLDGLLPPDTYFRFNPVMCENIPLDESRNEKLDQLQLEGMKYIERNEQKMKKVAKILSQEKTTLQKINDWIKLKTDMYEGLPFFSKLWRGYECILVSEGRQEIHRVSEGLLQCEFLWNTEWILGNQSWDRWCSEQLAPHGRYVSL